MRRSKSGHERKTSRRRSWFNGSQFISLFNSAPSSPERARRQSLDMSKRSLTDRPAKFKSTFSLFAKPQHRRAASVTTHESMFDMDDTASSDTTSIEIDISTTAKQPDLAYFQKSQQQQLLKTDEDEADRMQLKNDLVKLAFEGEFSLPFDYKDIPSARILDLGCGEGSWCIDLSQKYPSLDVIGIDSEDIFPSERNLPSNCQLMVCDVLNNGLVDFAEASFDVIHIRFMVLAFTVEQYTKVVEACWRLLKPGGHIEILEADLKVYSAGPITLQLNQDMLDVAARRGLDPKYQASHLAELIPMDATARQEKYRSIPMGVWGGRIGVLCRDDMIHLLTKFYDHFDKDKQLFGQEINCVMREMEHYKSFTNYYFYTAQKLNVVTPPPSMRRQFTSNSINPKAF